jgi:hypothetical protein
MFHEISYWDLDFDRVAVPFYDTAGVPQTKWVKTGMPRIPQNVINGVFYLYATVEDAKAGRNPGGTGFIVRFDTTYPEMYGKHFFYGVTNWHVACRGHSVIRLNNLDGTTAIIDFGPDQWFFMPGKYDVAVVELTIDEKVHAVSSISTREFAAEPEQDAHNPSIALGDDVFMIGLFFDNDGAEINIPSARFGNIGMLPNAKALLEQPTGYKGVSYVVDMHSRTGFSGSPVYVYRTFGSDLMNLWGHEFEIDGTSVREFGNRVSGRLRTRNLFKLLGIHWGQFREKWPFETEKPTMQESQAKLIVEGRYVTGWSGMTCVIPAWQIYEVLNMPELKKQRGPAATFPEPSFSKPAPESAAPADDDTNPNHLSDFNRLVDVAARKKSKD